MREPVAIRQEKRLLLDAIQSGFGTATPAYRSAANTLATYVHRGPGSDMLQGAAVYLSFLVASGGCELACTYWLVSLQHSFLPRSLLVPIPAS